MKYSQLNEGVIKVPQSLMGTLNKYVASTLSTMLYKNIETVQDIAARLPENAAQEQVDLIQRVIGYLKSNYGAVILNDNIYNSITKSGIKVPIDFNSFFSELNIPVSAENKQKIMSSSLTLSLKHHISDGSEGFLAHDVDNTTFMIELKCDINYAPLDKNIFVRCKDIMASAYHETQHYIQNNVISRINPNQKQLQRPNDNLDQNKTQQDFTDYLSSGIEYAPWMGDTANAIITQIEVLKANGELGSNGLNTLFMDLLKQVCSIPNKSYGKFLYSIAKKDMNQYKNAVKRIYKIVQPAYDSIKDADQMQVLGDLKQEDLPVDFDVMSTLMNDLKPAVQTNGGKFQAFGRSYDSITKIKISYPDFEVEIVPRNGTYTFNMSSTDDTIHTYSPELSGADAIQLAYAMKRYGDDDAMVYGAIEQTKSDGEFSTEVLNTLFERLSTKNHEMNDEPVQYTSQEIVLGGITYEVKPQDGSYIMESPELILLTASFKNSLSLSMFLQDIMYAISRVGAQKVQEELENCFSAYDATKVLRNL